MGATMKKPVVLLIDGDILVYKLGFAAEKNIDWGDGVHTLSADEGEVRAGVDRTISQLKEELHAASVVVALTCHDTPNFRKEFYPDYKAQRTARKPLCWLAVRNHLIKMHGARIKPNLEADDVIGILATIPSTGQDRIVVSIDKDFKSVPCKYYNMKSKQLMNITETQADRMFMQQTLTGDTIDNFKGIPGVGPKTASKILDFAPNLPSMWAAVVQAYKNHGLSAEEALTQARCARILRATDYDSPSKKPILWNPPQITKEAV
jgi:5'-3' exonuclease